MFKDREVKMNIITVKNLVKDYVNNNIAVNAIRGVDLNIEEGEFAAIAGPSGSGKTTLLNIIGGLDSPTSGEVTVAGELLNKLIRSLPGRATRPKSDGYKIGFQFSQGIDSGIQPLGSFRGSGRE